MQTIDDVSTGIDTEAAEPGIVMVASGREPAARVLGLPAELGRKITAPGVTLDVADDRMSRDHALVKRDAKGWVITDRESRNGTFLDGDRIVGEIKRRGDVVLRLGHTVFVLLEDVRGQTTVAGKFVAGGDDVVGPELARAYAEVDRAATGDSLLVHGESGSGKELAARRFHERQGSARKSGPFVAVNCATIPEGVAERLLFGSKKGAFSGAIESPGHFQMAAGGTLFLDEVAELDAAVQAKLLRVLETREVQPVGASTGTPIDIGVVAASHRELRGAVADRKFREDLYYRLARVVVQMPPLRARKVDIARLVQREVAAAKLAVHPKLLETCCTRAWPGNVRELLGAIREAIAKAAAANHDLVRVEHFSETAGLVIQPTADTKLERPSGATPAPELDKAAVEAALAKANGVVAVAARALGLHRTQLYRLMDKLGIARADT